MGAAVIRSVRIDRVAWLCWWQWLGLLLGAGFAVAVSAQPYEAGDATGSAAVPVASEPAMVSLHNRRIVMLRATLLGDSPRERAALAQAAIGAALARGGPGRVSHVPVGDAVRFELDGDTLFFLVGDDLEGPRGLAGLEAAAQKVAQRLQVAVAEASEIRDPRRLAVGLAHALAATLLVLGLAWALRRLRRRLLDALAQRLRAWHARHPAGSPLGGPVRHLARGARGLGRVLSVLLWLLLADAWITYVLHQFAYTRPWGEASTAWLLDLLRQFALAIAGAVPGLLTALVIFLLARLVSRAVSLLLLRIERGEFSLGWLDADTATPTRWLASIVIWLFALAMAYPHLPGAHSEAFQAVSVLAGLMLSLGASSVVGQALAGLGLMYARSLRVGEYVKVGDTEGTVVSVGVLSTKIETGLGEEVSLPSALLFGQPVRNFSRLGQGGGFVLHTAVTIGYATPWRQVHAMLLEAAQRTPGVAAEPPPFVVQTALSDFYVEYRLCAQSLRQAPARRIEVMNRLHGHIQDVFNEHGVQIMSPHYRADPAQPQVVPPEAWFTPPARPPAAGGPHGPAPGS